MLKTIITFSLPLLAVQLAACDNAISTVTSTGTKTTTMTTSVDGVAPAASADPALISSIVNVVVAALGSGQSAPMPATSAPVVISPISASTSVTASSSVAASSPAATSAAAASAPSAKSIAPSAGSSAPAGSSVAASTAAAPVAAATTGCKSYTVNKDDTGYNIAKSNGITLPQLTAQNPGIVWEKIQVGQTLVLPPSATGAGLGSAADCKPPAVASAPAANGPASGSVAASSASNKGPSSGSATAAASASGPKQVAPSGSAAAAPASSGANATPSKKAGTVAATTAAAATPTATGTSGPGTTGVEPASALAHMGAQTDCSKAEFKDECATAKDAAPHLIKALETYKIGTAAEQAAILSLVIFESEGFKYNINHFPGNPGQGTRNMMSPAFIKEYAAFLKLSTDGSPEEVLKRVLGPEHSFASGAWFYSAKCDATVKEAVKAGNKAGYETYLKDCIGTESTPQRLAGYDKAREALGVPKT